MKSKKIIFITLIAIIAVTILLLIACGQVLPDDGEEEDSSNVVEDTANWNKMFDGSNDSDILYSTAVDSNNNLYVVGCGYNIVSGSNSWDWWIKKFDSDGSEDTINWNKKYNSNGTFMALDMAYTISIDSNNNIYVAGYGYNLVSGLSGQDWWIKKFDSDGNEDTTNWNLSFDNSNDSDSVHSLKIDSNNNVYAVGHGTSLVSSSSNSDWWIKKFDANGIEDAANWNKKIDGDGSDDVATSIAIDSNNNIYVSGYGTNLVSSSSGSDWWIKKFDSNGIEDTINWNKQYDLNGYGDETYSISIDSENNVYLSGIGVDFVSSQLTGYWWIKKFDSNGIENTTNWNIKKALNGYVYATAIDSGDNLYVAGNIDMFSNTNWCIKKYNNTGIEDTANWNKIIDGNGSIDCAYSISIDSSNSIYITGFGSNIVSGSSSADWWIKKCYYK